MTVHDTMFHPQGPTFFELARQALSSTRRGYDLLAPKFDYTPFRTPDWIIDRVAPYIGQTDSIDAALDLCCGTGVAMRMLRPLCRERVVGIDFSPGMMEVGRQQMERAAGEARVEWVQGDVLEMTIDSEFDVATCFGALGHVLPKDEPRFVERIWRALKPGGRFVFVTSTRPPLWSRAYWLSRGFNAAMHVRNLLIRPPFVMFYLTFLLPRATQLLEAQGFQMRVIEGAFGERWPQMRLVIATRPA